MVSEGLTNISINERVFYNPEMELCRDISVLAVQAIGEKLTICDGLCATGIRGIRYMKENSNVERVVFVDFNRNAYFLAKKNISSNKLHSCTVSFSEMNKYLVNSNEKFNFIELDPFGSPVPYLYNAIRYLSCLKESYISVTATDTAVLCGAQPKAALKYYQTKPLNSEYCHEIGIRILLSKIARIASEFNLGIESLLSLSRRHYLKVFVKFVKGNENVMKSLESLGYIGHCNKCLNREISLKLPNEKKCSCGNAFEFSYPLWLGSMSSRSMLKSMQSMLKKRNYRKKSEIEKILNLMHEESEMPPTYYDIHEICAKLKLTPPSLSRVVKEVGKKHSVSLTHFKDNCIRADCGITEIKKAIEAAISKKNTL